jgi:hypothetical protein
MFITTAVPTFGGSVFISQEYATGDHALALGANLTTITYLTVRTSIPFQA